MTFPLLVAAAVGCCGVTGVVRSSDGAPLRAHVHVAGPTKADADSDARGGFALTIPPGVYRVTINAPGFAAAETDVIVHEGERIDVALDPIGSGRLREIGRVTVDGRLSVSRTTVPSREITRADMDASGYDRIIDSLANVPSLTLARPGGGSRGAVAVVALRGPDPSETRITLDGQPLNDANTGDLDLALFPSALLAAVDVSEGLGPEDHRGADTIGGEINLVSLRPTATPTRMLRLSAGSFGTTSAELNATGRIGRFGYALAGGRAHSDGYVHDYPVRLNYDDAAGNPATIITPLGSEVDVSTGLAHFTYDLSPRATLRFRTLTVDSRRNESAAQTAPVDPANDARGADFVGSGPQVRWQNIRATLLGATLPLGAGTLTATTAFSSTGLALERNADLTPTGASPYDFSLNDRLTTTTLEWTRVAGTSTFAAGASARAENLTSSDQFPDTLREHATSVWLRGATDIAPRVRLAASVVRSKWSTFGTSTDGRVGVVVDDGANGALRFAVGTGFRAPLLAELATLPASALAPDANCVAANGNPNEHAEHATEYELGYGKRIGKTTVDATLYRSNLRDAIEIFYPLGTSCPGGISTVVAQSFPINVGNVIYQGGALRMTHRFGALLATAEYGVNAAYPTSLPVTVANPTSGADLVIGQQFAGIPIQTFSLGLRYAREGLHGALNFTAKSANNELAQPRFATLDAAIGKRWNRVDVTVAGTNLTNAVSGRFTRLGLGTPYATMSGPPLEQDALVLQPAAVRLILTLR
jgi:outer membrane receptor for ferrienterochelin and colicin